MSAEDFLADSKPAPVEKVKDYNAAAAHYYQLAIMHTEEIEETEIVGFYHNGPAIPGRALNDK